MSAKHDAKTRKVYNARQVVKHLVMLFTKARRHRPLCTEFGRTRRCQKVDRVRHGRQGPRMFCAAQNSGHQVIKLTIPQVPSSANLQDIAESVRNFAMGSHRYWEVLS